MTTTYAADQAETLHHQRSTRPKAARRATALLAACAAAGLLAACSSWRYLR